MLNQFIMTFAMNHWICFTLIAIPMGCTILGFMYGLTISIFRLLFILPNRILRSINIVFKGWPPSHLDADGDFRPVENKEE